MSKNKTLIDCVSCTGECVITHTQDPDDYVISYCPFCGSEIIVDDLEADDLMLEGEENDE